MTDQPTTDQPTTELPVNKAPRQSHTPAERATEAVNVLQRRLDKLTKSKAAFELQALELEPQIEAMQKRRDYALSNPDLPKAPVGQKTTSVEEFHTQVVAALESPWPGAKEAPTT